MEVPHLIVDLAIMLTTAAVVTITFKKLNIPSILGYILAGFLISPNFPLFLDISSQESIETWSEIGVVIILFHIGLEFDFHKLADIGSTAIVSAAVKMGGVMFIGYAFGRLLGMSTMNCVFLGAMLSISSTVVIQKCFDEMGLSEKKFAKLVMGSLVMEDVFAVFMMVILTTMAASKAGSTADTVTHLFFMTCYLVIWLIIGIFLVPTFLNKAMDLMNDETLTLLSIGFCFLMALLAHWLGFSMELGAFLAGSFFASTVHVHDIERVTSGIKDMFGAVFFLSVGMMVDPAIITSRWTSIVPIAIVAVVAKLIFATIGVLLSGQDAETAIRAGTSLAPIGEFSFIIASLGITLGVMDEYLYPVIVAASILTIMFTPVFIKQTDSIIALASRILPERIKEIIRNYTSSDQDREEHTSEWKVVLKDYFLKFIIYGSIMAVAVIAGCKLIYPNLPEALGDTGAAIVSTALIYVVILVFAMPFLGRRNAAFTKLWVDRLSNRPPLVAMMMLKIGVLILLALIPLIVLFDMRNPLLLLLIPAALYLIGRSDFISTYYLQLEARFLANLNQTTIAERAIGTGWMEAFDEDYFITSWYVPKGAPYAGKSLADLKWGKYENVYVVKIKRDEKNITMPLGKTVIMEGDKIHGIGDKTALPTFLNTIATERAKPIRTLREFIAIDYDETDHALALATFKVRGTERYVGKTVRKSKLNISNRVMILGIEREGYAIKMPDPNMRIEKGDILWLIGTSDNLSIIAAQSVGEVGSRCVIPEGYYEKLVEEKGGAK
ncbi:MAG: cation:proton antiporter [Mogibacterium sp.]|nr:cation:proton antiporter [Mogibacterium sp.]